MAKITEAFVEIRARTVKLQGDLKKARGLTVASAAGIGAAAGAAVVLGIGAAFVKLRRIFTGFLSFAKQWGTRLSTIVTGGIKKTISMASDAEMVLRRFEITMGSALPKATKFVDTLVNTLTRSRTEVRHAVATFQKFFIGFGFAKDDAADLSTTMTQLVIDFAAWNKMADDEAMGKFISAISGSGIALAQFGVNIDQTSLDQELLRRGFKKSTQGATEQQKVIARLAIIMKAMGDQGAIGSAAATQEKFAMQVKALQGALRNLGDTIGTEFLKSGGGFIGILTQIVKVLETKVAPAAEFARKVFDKLRESIMEFTGTTGFFTLNPFEGLVSAAKIALAQIEHLFITMFMPLWDKIVIAFANKVQAGIEIVFTKVFAPVLNALKKVSEMTPKPLAEFFGGPLPVLGPTGNMVIGALLKKIDPEGIQAKLNLGQASINTREADLTRQREKEAAASQVRIDKLRIDERRRIFELEFPGGLMGRRRGPGGPGLPEPTIPGGLGGGAADPIAAVAQSLVQTIQAATGSFKAAQRDRMQRIQEEQAESLNAIERNTRHLGDETRGWAFT
jgi:hypothetical protein